MAMSTQARLHTEKIHQWIPDQSWTALPLLDSSSQGCVRCLNSIASNNSLSVWLWIGKSNAWVSCWWPRMPSRIHNSPLARIWWHSQCPAPWKFMPTNYLWTRWVRLQSILLQRYAVGGPFRWEINTSKEWRHWSCGFRILVQRIWMGSGHYRRANG